MLSYIKIGTYFSIRSATDKGEESDRLQITGLKFQQDMKTGKEGNRD